MADHIWLIANSFTRWLWVPLARHIAAQTGLKPVLLLQSEQDKTFYAKQPGADELIYRVLKDPYETVVSAPAESLPDHEVSARLAACEQEFGFSVMREMLLPDRHLGRGYMLAGSGHPQSHTSDKSSFGNSLRACLEQVDFTLALFAEFPPAAVICYYGGGGIRYKPIAAICRARDIPFRAFCPARFGGLAYWAEDEYEGSSHVVAALAKPEALPSEAEAEILLRDIAPSALATDPGALRRLRRLAQWPHIIKRAAHLVAQRAYSRLRGYKAARTGYLVSSSIAHMLRMRSHWRLLDRLALRKLPDLSGRKVVYFPLQQEPEASTLVLSPKNTNQLATITELSLALPADAILVVKEHIWQIGRRPDWFYDALRSLPNVLLVHPEASGREMIERADLVATITSSAGFEAAAMGKMVVFFWDRSPLLPLPHVHDMTRGQGLERIAAMLHEDSEAAAAERKLQGALFLRKLRQACLDVAPMRFYSRSEAPTKDELDMLTAPLFADGALRRSADEGQAGQKLAG